MRHNDYGRDQGRGMSGQSDMRRGDNPPNLGSARSDYGNLAYGGRLNQEGMDRGWWDRTSDEVSSWFGDDEAERRRQMDDRRDDMSGNRGNYGRSNFAGRRSGSYGGENDYSRTQNRDWRELRAADIMTRDVMTLHPDDSIQHAARMMADCDCGAIPVVDWQGRMIGMITDRDITVRIVADRADLSRARVGDGMTDETFACHATDPIEHCMNQMARHQIRRLPIVDDRNRVVGILSQGDLAQFATETRGRGGRRQVGDVVGRISEPSEEPYR